MNIINSNNYDKQCVWAGNAVYSVLLRAVEGFTAGFRVETVSEQYLNWNISIKAGFTLIFKEHH